MHDVTTDGRNIILGMGLVVQQLRDMSQHADSTIKQMNFEHENCLWQTYGTDLLAVRAVPSLEYPNLQPSIGGFKEQTLEYHWVHTCHQKDMHIVNSNWGQFRTIRTSSPRHLVVLIHMCDVLPFLANSGLGNYWARTSR
jgi:hypothetical protein